MLFLMASLGVFAQNYIQHTVVKDDTVTSMARKYSVTVHDIYTLNPDTKNGIKLDDVILIPKNEKNAKYATGTYHTVQPKETFFGIAQKYGVTVQAIQEANKAILENGLQPGLELFIPTGKKAESSTTITKNDDIIHIVQPQETFFGITQKYEISKEELVVKNPQLKNGLKAGDTLKIPFKKPVNEDNTFEAIRKKELKNFAVSNKEKKEVVVMLPFRASRIGNAQESFKTDKFLNITVDFYSGMMMAIDEIREKGGNFNITIYDSEEVNATNSSIEHLIKTNDFSDVDLVIGPFYQSHSEKTASLLESKGVLVVSPISREGKAIHKNLYFATPPSEVSKKMMLDYLKGKNQNTIAVVDRKKSSSKEFISQNYEGIPFVGFDEKGGIDSENLKSLLNKDKTNYVILETESTSMVLNTANLLSKLKDSYNIIMVALDRNNAFESDEIKSQTLADLNLHYPSDMNESTSEKLSSFYTEYRSKNNVLPSAMAVKGYDITYDVLLRLAQSDKFEKTADKFATQQEESKFNYIKSSDGGYYNAGIYILYYDTDLTIKEAE